MKITLELTPEKVQAIARHLDDPACLANDIVRDSLAWVIGQAWIHHGVSSPEILRILAQDHARFGRARRTPRALAPRKTHLAPQ